MRSGDSDYLTPRSRSLFLLPVRCDHCPADWEDVDQHLLLPLHCLEIWIQSCFIAVKSRHWAMLLPCPAPLFYPFGKSEPSRLSKPRKLRRPLKEGEWGQVRRLIRVDYRGREGGSVVSGVRSRRAGQCPEIDPGSLREQGLEVGRSVRRSADLAVRQERGKKRDCFPKPTLSFPCLARGTCGTW